MTVGAAPRFSIILTTYNYAHVLPRAVQSVLGQNGDDYELLVIDDGSSDDTATVVENLLAENSGQMHYLLKPNGGAASARNFGIDHARGEYILFLDADDELCPGLLDELRAYFTEHPDTEFLVGGHLSVSPDGREKLQQVPELPADLQGCFEAYVVRKLPISHGCSISHRRIFDTVRYPEQFRATEDIPVFAQSVGLFRAASLNIPFARIHKHDDSLRHCSDHVVNAGLAVVDALFDPDKLPPELMAYRDGYRVRRCLSLFRSCYLAGRTTEAGKFYREAVRTDWRALLQLSYLRKYLRMWWQDRGK